MWTKIALAVSLGVNMMFLLLLMAFPRVVPPEPKVPLEEFLAGADPKAGAKAPTVSVRSCNLKIKFAWHEAWDKCDAIIQNTYPAPATETLVMQPEPSFLESQALHAQQDFYSEAAREIRRQRQDQQAAELRALREHAAHWPR